ncbi:14462_t:CDS:2 [Acaulospora morrowiae]|uniref:14462_t:CDS:1 n=1 Tax=Acaulospora morrowiae TaxID=94023 RepID=A0A9N8WIC2_9GLOM|nr:14462_t:CDS:2 [Acaulospora morrowiae]
MSSQYTLNSSLKNTTSKYNDNLVTRNNGKIIKKITTVKKTILFKRSIPISSRKADITQEMNILNHKYLKFISVLESDITDISIEGNFSDIKNMAKYYLHLTKVEEPTGEPNIMTIFSNYTDAEEAYTYPISEFENFKSKLALMLYIYETNRKSVRIWNILQHFFKKDIITGSIKFDPIEYIQMQTTGPYKSAVVIFTYQLDYDTAIND